MNAGIVNKFTYSWFFSYSMGEFPVHGNDLLLFSHRQCIYQYIWLSKSGCCWSSCGFHWAPFKFICKVSQLTSFSKHCVWQCVTILAILASESKTHPGTLIIYPQDAVYSSGDCTILRIRVMCSLILNVLHPSEKLAIQSAVSLNHLPVVHPWSIYHLQWRKAGQQSSCLLKILWSRLLAFRSGNLLSPPKWSRGNSNGTKKMLSS